MIAKRLTGGKGLNKGLNNIVFMVRSREARRKTGRRVGAMSGLILLWGGAYYKHAAINNLLYYAYAPYHYNFLSLM